MYTNILTEGKQLQNPAQKSCQEWTARADWDIVHRYAPAPPKGDSRTGPAPQEASMTKSTLDRPVSLPPASDPLGQEEKRRAAAASVSAAVLLTALKLATGLATNSLGVLSEAAHSALDLMAAGMTYTAVRIAAFLPDSGHPYGHGKVENLSALVETLLLIITCVWITREAVDRLFF